VRDFEDQPPEIQLIFKRADASLLIKVGEDADDHYRQISEQHQLEYANGVHDAAQFLRDGLVSDSLFNLIVEFSEAGRALRAHGSSHEQ